MALNPCKFHLSDGKVLTFDEAQQYLYDNPDLMVEIPVAKASPGKKSTADNALDYLQKLLDDTQDVVGVNAELYRTAIKGMMAAIKAGKTVARAIREAIKYLTDNGVSQQEAEQVIGKHREPLQKLEGTKPQTRQKAVETRAATGTADEQVKEAIKKYGLDYEVESFSDAQESAQELVDEIGLEAALDAVRKKMIGGAPAAAIMSMVIDSYSTKLAQAKNQTEVAQLYNQQADLIDELDKMAREYGRFNSFMQFVYANSDFGYSFEKQVEEYKKINQGEISDEVLAKFKEYDQQIKEARKRIAELESEQEDRNEKRALANMDEEFNRPKPLTVKQKAQRAANFIRNSMKLNRSDVFNSTSPAALVWDGAVEVVATTIEAGGTVAQAIQDGIAYIRQSDWYKGQNETIQKTAEKAFKDRVKSETKTQIVFDDEGKLKIPYAFLKEAYLSGAKTIESLVDAVQQEVPDATPRQIRDAITRYGQKLNPTQDEVKDSIQKQKSIGRLISQIEDAQNGILKTTDPKKKKSLTEREEQLRKQLKALTNIPQDADKTRLNAAKKRAQSKLEELEQRIVNKDFSTKKAAPLEADEELENLRAKVTEAQGRFDRAKYEAEIRNRGFWGKLGDFATEFANIFRVLFATGELSFITIQGANIASSNIWTQAGRKANSTAFRNLWDHFKSEKAAETWMNKIKNQPWYENAKKAGLSLTEQHAKLSVQEELLVTGYANKYWEWLGKPIEMVSKKAFEKWKKANPLLAFERAANGFLNTLRVSRYLQGVEMLERDGITPKDNPEAYKDLASAVNTLTGRTKITNDENVSKGLSVMFFSARNMASTIINSTPIAFWYYGRMRGGAAKGVSWNQAEYWKPTAAQKIAVTDLMRMTVNNLSVLGMVAAYQAITGDDDEEEKDKWKIELDPRSSLFLQIKHGKTSIDMWHGMRPWWVFQTRIIMEAIYSITKEGAYKSAKTGEIRRLGEGLVPSASDLAVSQITSRFSPSAGLIWDWMSAHYDEDGNRITKFREPYDIQQEAVERLYPMYVGTVKEVAKENTPLMTSFLAAIGYVGLGINTEMEKNKTPQQYIKEILNPQQETINSDKKQLKEAIKDGNMSESKRLAQKYMGNFSDNSEKYKAIKQIYKDATDETFVTNKLGVADKNLDEFFKILENEKLERAGKKKQAIVHKMKQVANDPELTKFIKDKLSSEYEKASKTLKFVNELKIKSPVTNRTIEFSKPVWMKKYERIVLNKK